MKHTFNIIWKDGIFFLIPFFCWVIIGALFLLFSNYYTLFYTFNNHYTSLLLDKLFVGLSAFGRGDVLPFLFAIPLCLKPYRTKFYLSIVILFSICVPTLIFLFKIFFNAPRPLSVFGFRQVHTVTWMDNFYNYSFPSGHTIAAFGFFMLMTFLIPHSQKKYTILFFLLALGCGISRIYLGQHFFSDVYAGSIVGTFLSVIIYFIGITFFSHKHES